VLTRHRYALVLETDRYEVLIELRHLWKPPRVVVRRGLQTAEIWLFDDDVRPVRPGDFSPPEEHRILTLVRHHFDELVDWVRHASRFPARA
jgi:hypothetical protein